MQGNKYKYYFIVADLFIIFTGFTLTVYLVQFEHNIDFFSFIGKSISLIGFGILIALINIFIFEVNNLYKINIILSRAAHLSSILKSIYYSLLTIVLIAILYKSSENFDSKYLVILFPLLVVPLFFLIRIGLLRLIYLKISKTHPLKNILIVGDGKAGKLLAAKLIFENPIGIKIVGFVNTEDDGSKTIFGEDYLGKVEDVKQIVEDYKINEIIIAIDGLNYEQILGILDYCKSANIEIKVNSDIFEIIPKKIVTEKYADIPMVELSKVSNNALTLAFKRLFDFIVTLIGIILLAPMFLIIALAIKLTSKGPVIYSQIRIGKNGVPFKFYKFRSMTVETSGEEKRKEEMINFIKKGKDTAGTKIINESRITKVGCFLRKTSLDELPQLFNVLKGDMSLVGPRPCLPYEYEQYNSWQKRRLNVMPGCTGVWQVMGRSSVSFNDSVVMDLYYINNMSPWLDLELILKTIPTMIFAKGGK